MSSPTTTPADADADAAPVLEESPRTDPIEFGSPFDDDDADIVLRSSDLVDFSTYRVILAKASPVFKSMLSITQPSSSSSDSLPNSGDLSKRGLPVVPVSEESLIIHSLLSLIMPVELSPPSSLDEAFMIASAAQKYDMRSAMERSRGLLRNFVSDSNCIRAYGTAYRLRLREEMIMAAPLTLRRDLSLSSLGADLRDLTGSALYDLWVYRATCAKVISKFIDQKISNGDGAEWLPRGHSTSASRGCISTAYGGIMRTSIPAWYHAFVGQISQTMADDPERRFPSRSQKFDSLISACQDHSKHCRYCLEKYDHVDVYRQMWAKLMDAIDDVIAQVDLATQFAGF